MANGTMPKPRVMPGTCMDIKCATCGENIPEGECEHSQRPCGHHCNHSWCLDQCCWCLEQFGEEPNTAIPGNLERVVREKQEGYTFSALHAMEHGDVQAAAMFMGHHNKLARGEYPPAWGVTNDG